MGNVVISIDPHKLLSPSAGSFQVEGISDYIPACLAIRETLSSPDSRLLQLHVTYALVGDWLKELAQRYGEEHIRFRQYTARDALQEKWQIKIPELRDVDIISSGLLNIQITPREGQSFENIILEHFFHDFFAYPQFPPEHFTRWLNELDTAQWEQNNRRLIPARLLRERLDTWKMRESNDARRSLISRISKDPLHLRNTFARYKVLHRYPIQLQEKVLGDEASVFRKAGVNPENLDLQEGEINQALIELEYYLTELCEKLQEASEFDQLLDSISGYLPLEYTYVENILRGHPDWITADRLRKIERRFETVRSSIETRISRLRSLIAAPRPAQPDASWTVDRWLEWVKEEYTPYQRWLEAMKKYDPEIAGYAATFADWYYEHFIELKNSSPEYFAFSTLFFERQRMIQGEAVTLVILLDNFNYAFFPELRRLFNQQNVSLMVDRPVLSLPPTATEVGKAAIVAVTGNLTDIDGRDYSSMVTTYWQPALAHHRKKAKYLPSIGELQQLSKLEHDVYFLNYLPIDRALHENSQEVGQDHLALVTNHLQTLVKSVVEFTRRFQLEKRLLVYVISDHGSTRIGKDVVNVLDKNWYKGIADIKHHRYIAISDQQVKELPQMATAQCYLIERKRFETHRNYLAARAYYRFVDSTEDFYVHGGLLPEEVVVPFARFEFQPIQIKPPTFRLLTQRFRYMIKSTVEIELGNPNDYLLENISIRLSGAPAEEAFIAALPSKRPVKIRFDTVFKKEPGAGDTRDLALRIQYDCQERTYPPVEIPFQVTVKAMMETSDDFDF